MESIPPVSSSNSTTKRKKVLSEFVQSLTISQPISLTYYRNSDTKEPDLQLLKKALKNNYIIVRFVKTSTELGMSLKTDDPQFFAKIEGDTLIMNGRLKLDYTPFKMIAEIDTKTYEGTGYLTEIEDWVQKKKT